MEENSYFFRVFDAISESKFYKSLTPELGYQHKIGHIQKVLVFSQMIAFNERLNEEEEKILLVAAAFHDSGRIKDRDNGEHGEASSDIVGTYFKENPSNIYEITLDEIGLVQVAIAYHVIPEKIQGQVLELVKAIFKNSWENSRNYVSDEKENEVERVWLLKCKVKFGT